MLKNVIKYKEGSDIPNFGEYHYMIQPGDTLSKLSKVFNVPVDQLAQANDIADPNKIYQHQTLNVPVNQQQTQQAAQPIDPPIGLTLDQIPQTHHPHRIIDNYSRNYDYLVQGDRIYYRIKNNKNWFDISNNLKAKKNLYNFLMDKYNLRGYSQEERNIYDLLVQESSNQPKPTVVNQNVGPIYETPEPTPPHWTEGKGIRYNLLPRPGVSVTQPAKKSTRSSAVHPIPGVMPITSKLWPKVLKTGLKYYNYADKYIQRQREKTSNDLEPITIFNPTPIDINSDYEIVQPQVTGDTIRLTKDQYYLPEVIDLNNVRLGYRNRKDPTPIETDGAIVTAATPFIRRGDIDPTKVKEHQSFIGVSPQGDFKYGLITDFDDDDMISRSQKNTVVDFKRDAAGKIVFEKRNKNNPNNPVPVVIVRDDNGNLVTGSLNLLTKHGNRDENTFGNITGGRYVLQAGNEVKLVSGSVKDIEREFLNMKTRHPEVNFYTIDNGTFTKALRTYDRKLSSAKLKSYEESNSGGGNFLYLIGDGKKPNKYPETKYQTPNIRTVNDESYKKGHPLENERKVIVLHHTAFQDPNLTNVHNLFMTPKGNRSVSTHALIGYDGRDSVNDLGIGVEFQGDTRFKRLTKEQIKSAAEYLYNIILENQIPLEHIVSYKMVSPKRKPHDINDIDYNNIIQVLKDKMYVKKSNLKKGGIIKHQQGNQIPQPTRQDSLQLLQNMYDYEKFLSNSPVSYEFESKPGYPGFFNTLRAAKDTYRSDELRALIRGARKHMDTLPFEKYYRDIPGTNMFEQRDLKYYTMNLDAPIHLYHKQIVPYEIRRGYSQSYDDAIEYGKYHPLQVTPFDMVPPEARLTRQLMFGVNPGEPDLVQEYNQRKNTKSSISKPERINPPISKMNSKPITYSTSPTPSVRGVMPDRIEFSSFKHPAYKGFDISHYTDSKGRWTAKFNPTIEGFKGKIITPFKKGGKINL